MRSERVHGRVVVDGEVVYVGPLVQTFVRGELLEFRSRRARLAPVGAVARVVLDDGSSYRAFIAAASVLSGYGDEPHTGSRSRRT